MNKAFIKDLVENKKEHIEFKKAKFKKADAVLNVNFVSPIVNKALHTSSKNDTESVIKRTIIGNTYNWLDSHGDVHVDGTFGKSIKERGGVNKIWHLHDHEQKVTAKIGKPLSVKEEIVEWSDLGVDKIGSTTVVMMETNIMKTYNSFMFQEYKDGNIDQHSVGMFYVKIDLAVNDDEYKEEFALWNDNIDKLGNKAYAEEIGYMWIVKEAKLIEISAVLEGSNILTPTIASKDIEPLQDTQKVEPSQDTQNIPSSSKSTTYYY
jgi:hypothetical protein